MAAAFSLRPAPDALALPHVWRGRELAQMRGKTLASGHAVLDAELPGGGWPLGGLIEILQPEPQRHVWQLLHPALAAVQAEVPGPLVLVSPPFEPFVPALRHRRLQGERILRIQAEAGRARLWATEQALKCGEVAAVLAWLPAARSEELRRLHLCAAQMERLFFVFRGLQFRASASPAPLRLVVQGHEQLEVQVIKRRGPPLARTLRLPAEPRSLAAVLSARRHRSQPHPAPHSGPWTVRNNMQHGLPFEGPGFAGPLELIQDH